MGSSRASTPAGRRRTAPRRGAAAPARRPAAKRPPKKTTAKKAPAKTSANKAPPKKTTAKKAPAKRATSLRARAPRIAVAAVLVIALLAAGYQLWFRNASFVAVEQVSVSGIAGPERGPVEAALAEAAAKMTTLNVDEDALRGAVAGFPTVVDVEADADFPRDLTITVIERPPVLIATAGEQTTPVAGDGTILAGVAVGDMNLPSVAVDKLPAEGAVTGDALALAGVMGAAPAELRELVREVSIGGQEGLQVTLRGGIPVYFGASDGAEQKWAAAAAVLADPKIDTLTYLDVRVPERPAVGGAAPPVTASTTETTEPETTTVTP